MKVWRNQTMTISWAIIIAIMTLAPVPTAPAKPFLEIPHFDKLVHIGIFCFLSYLMINGLEKNSEVFEKKGKIVLSIVIPLFYGGLIELIQYYIPGRGADFYDFLADFVGIVIGIVTFYKLATYLGKG